MDEQSPDTTTAPEQPLVRPRSVAVSVLIHLVANALDENVRLEAARLLLERA